MKLSDAQVGRYWEDGFLFPLRAFDTDTAAELRAELLDFVDRTHQQDGLDFPAENYLRNNAHIVSSMAARLARAPELVEPVSSIIGDDVLLWMAEIFVKDPHSGGIVSMHQDLTYWGLGDTQDEVTVWLALGDVTQANGGMRFVRGSHRAGQAPHADTFAPDNLLSRGQVAQVDYDPADEVAVDLAAGEMSLHHGHMVHGSGPNTTDGPRVAMVFRYLSPSVRQHVAERDYVMVCRGSNRSNHLVSVAGAATDFARHDLDLFAEIHRAQSAALGEGADEDLRHSYNDT